MKLLRLLAAVLGLCAATARAQIPDAEINGLPDYQWFAGCFGTASGNLMGYWDRNGLPDFYTGPTGGGIAPLHSLSTSVGIRSLWASSAGQDGRPITQPGHLDDYWAAYEATTEDPYVLANRPEHAPDCIGDFTGMSQKKFTNMNAECDGNLDGFAFVHWDTNGGRRVNFTNAIDLQSGLKSWAQYRGYEADVFSQLVEFNPHTPPGTGFTWADLKGEIDAGYPLLIFLQTYDRNSRVIEPMTNANPDIHAMLAYGYEEYAGFGLKYVYARTSWGDGEGFYRSWDASPWVSFGGAQMSVRGVIGFHPRPRVRSISRAGGDVTVNWDGPTAQVTHHDSETQAFTTVRPHRYQLQQSARLKPEDFIDAGPQTTNRVITLQNCCDTTTFFRVKLLSP